MLNPLKHVTARPIGRHAAAPRGRRMQRVGGAIAALASVALVTAGGMTAATATDAATGSTSISTAVRQASVGASASDVLSANADTSEATAVASDADKTGAYDASAATTITASGGSAEVSGSDAGNVTVDGGTVTITGSGTYVVSGTLDGQVVVNADGPVVVANLVIVLAEEAGGGRRAVSAEPHIGLKTPAALGRHAEWGQDSGVDRRQGHELVLDDDLDIALLELEADRLAQLRLVVAIVQDVRPGLEHDNLRCGKSRGDLPGQLDADFAGAGDQDAPGLLKVGVSALDAGLGDDRGGLQVLSGERIGGAGGKDQVVRLDIPHSGHRHGGAPDAQGGAVNNPPTGQEVVVGQEDPLSPLTIDSGPQCGGMVDEGVLLLDEGHLCDIVEGLGDGDTAVSASNNGHARHIRPSGSRDVSAVSAVSAVALGQRGRHGTGGLGHGAIGPRTRTFLFHGSPTIPNISCRPRPSLLESPTRDERDDESARLGVHRAAMVLPEGEFSPPPIDGEQSDALGRSEGERIAGPLMQEVVPRAVQADGFGAARDEECELARQKGAIEDGCGQSDHAFSTRGLFDGSAQGRQSLVLPAHQQVGGDAGHEVVARTEVVDDSAPGQPDLLGQGFEIQRVDSLARDYLQCPCNDALTVGGTHSISAPRSDLPSPRPRRAHVARP